MVTFEPGNINQNAAFRFQLDRLVGLSTEMRQIRKGVRPEDLAGDAPLLENWKVGLRLIPCLMGYSTGHPKLVGIDRPIATSDLWLMSEDARWARTLSRWYRLGSSIDHDSRGRTSWQ